MSIKQFLAKYHYNSVQILVRQIAIAIFGLVLAISTSGALQIASSVFSVLFFLFLVYDISYTVGAKDGTSESCKAPKLTGLYIGLLANSLNILCALLGAVGWAVRGLEDKLFAVITQIGGLAQTVALFIEGMYTGVMTIDVAEGVPLNSCWWAYFVIVIPAIAISTLAYYLGRKNIGAVSIFIPRNAEDEEIKRERKRKRKGE